MKYGLIPIVITAILGCLVISSHVYAWDKSDHHPTWTDQKILSVFYRFLESIQTDSSEDQIAASQGFVKDHPSFERVYLKLLERYLFFDKRQEARVYFQKMASTSQYRPNSEWMLAKIFIIDDNPSAAFKAFSTALSAGSPPLLLLSDFIEFDHHQAGKFAGSALLRKLRLAPEIQTIVLSLYNYQTAKYVQAIKIFSSAPPSISQTSVILHIWGECYYRLARYQQADSLWRIGLANSKMDGDIESEAQFLTNLGILAGVSGQYEEELQIYDSAYALASRIGDIFRMQLLWGLRAYNYRVRMDYAAASQYAARAIGLAKKLGAYRYLMSWYWYYQQSLYFLGEFTAALNACDESEKYALKINNAPHVFISRLTKGDIYVYLNQLLLAKKTFQEAYNFAKLKGLVNEQQQIKVRLANLMFLEGEYAAAREIYQRVIKSQNQKNNPDELTYWIRRLGRTYELEGRYDLAKNEFLRALIIAQQAASETSEGWSALFIGNMEVMLGNITGAIQRYQRVYEIAVKQKYNEMLWQAFLGLGNAYKKAGDLNAAIKAYQQAVNTIEAARRDLKVDQLRIGYFREANQVYRNLVQRFLQRYEAHGNRTDLDSLFYYDELGRGRALQDLKQWEKTAGYCKEFLQARDKVRFMQHRLRLEADKFRSTEECKNLLSELEMARYSMLSQRLRVNEVNQYSKQREGFVVPSLSDVLNDLKRKDLGLLFYHISPESSFVLVATGNQAKIVRLMVKPLSLRSAIDSLVTPLHHVNQDSVQYTRFRAALAYRLYQVLVKPTEDALALPKRLLIVPDLELMNLPFEMLLMDTPDASDYTPSDFPSYADDFLVHRYTIVYSPSTSLLLEASHSLSQNSRVVVFANPFNKTSQSKQKRNTFRALTGWQFDPLPYAEVEAQRIKKIHSQTQVQKREDAAKKTFMQEAPKHQIVHFATHAFVDTSFDAFSGLVLAAGGDSIDDGMLMGYEISDLTLNCDLITLSACETGRGEVVAGEGVLGLPRLFLGAGAKSVLMTLWKVDDKFTSDLMPLFYDILLNQKLSKSDALTQAKRMILHRENLKDNIYYQHPFYWASFVLFGDAGVTRHAITGTVKLCMLLLIAVILSLVGIFSYRYFYR